MKRASVVITLVLVVGCGPSTPDTWSGQLRNTLSSADELLVRSGGTCRRERRIALTRILDRKEISGLADLFRIDEDASKSRHAGCGSPTFEFYGQGKLLTSLSIQEGRAVRWADGPWAADGLLTKGSADAIKTWLAERWITEETISKVVLDAERSIRRDAEEKWREKTPDVLKPFRLREFERSIEGKMQSALIKAHPRGLDRVRVLLAWFGSGPPWIESAKYMDIAADMLLDFTTDQMLQVLVLPDLTDQELDGAARLISKVYDDEQRIDMARLPDWACDRLLNHCLKSEDEVKQAWGRQTFMR